MERPAADPVPEFEHEFGLDAEIRRRPGFCRDGGEMAPHCRLAQRAGEPSPRRLRVSQGLDGGKGLGGDDE